MRSLVFVVLLFFALSAHAHKPSDSYLTLVQRGNDMDIRWDIALRDLDFAIGLDNNDDGNITWGELREKHEAVAKYALSRLVVKAADKPCAYGSTSLQVDRHSDGAYAVLQFVAECPDSISSLKVEYSLFFDLDAQHRGLWHLERAGQTDTGIFSTEDRSDEIALNAAPDLLRVFLRYSHEGIWHIWTGYDHILFLLSLLLPSVLRREHRDWQPVATLRPAFFDVVRVVTAFTLAHSVTLTLAALGILQLPTRLVESTIALSVVLAAVNNVYPLVAERRWMVAFGFGLLHGLGFASVLIDLGLPSSARNLALAVFNLGVEAGQLAIVASFLPLAFMLRQTRFYTLVVLQAGSWMIALLALRWFLQRGFGLAL